MEFPVKNAACKLLPLLGLCCLTALRSFAQSPAAVTGQYIRKYEAIAEEEMERTGVPAAISLAQGIIESESGKGWLVEHSHNHFGIKCKSNWTGQTIRYDDDHKNECFRVYKTDDSSWRDHSDFLKNTPRYAFLFQLDPLDYKAWAYGLKKAGYATNRQYAEKLIHTIEKYHLQRYSEQALALMRNKPGDEFAAMLDKKINADRSRMNIPVHKNEETVKADTPASPYPNGVFRINGRRVLYLSRGTQLIAVAEKYHIRLQRLLRFNELEYDELQKNTLVFLEKKGREGAHETHTVTPGETLHEIAQEEGIRMKWLCRRNRLADHKGPVTRKVLYLTGYAPEAGRGGSAGKDAAAENTSGFWYKLTHLFSPKKDVAAGNALKDKTDFHRAEEEQRNREQPVAEKKDTAAAAGTGHRAGQISKQENHSPETVNYEVRQGDTLYGISRKYGVTVEQIQSWNNLTGNTIRVGQQLIVRNQ